MNKQAGRLIGVGMGPGAVRYLTLEAVEVLRRADILIDVAGPRTQESLSERIIDELGGCGGERVHFVTPMSRDLDARSQQWAAHAKKVLSWIHDGKEVAYVTLGDPLIYSTFGYLRRALLAWDPHVCVEVVPGITSFQTAASRTGEPLLENDEILALLPATLDSVKREALLAHVDTAVLLKAVREKPEVIQSVNAILEAKSFVYASRLEMVDEFVTTNPVTAMSQPDGYLSLFISRRKHHDYY
jgi:precorrin-2 C20-methyltransferase